MSEKNPDSKKKPVNDYLKYSGMAIQMGVIISIGAYLGQELDRRLGTEKPYLTVVLSLLAIFVALYLILKDILRKDN